MLHKNITVGDRHPPHNFEYASQAARLAAAGFVAGDIGKLALQLDDVSHWVLTATTPTWAALGGAGAQGIQGIQGAQGDIGPAGSTVISGITGLRDELDGKTDISGFPDDATGNYLCTLTYDETTRTVTITPTGASFDIYCAGVKYTKVGAQSIVHGTGQGGHFIYYDATGTLVTGLSPWDLLRTAPACFVFWDATNSRGIAFNERHHAGRDVYWHRNQHANEGTKISSGFAISGYTINLQSDVGVTVAVATGRVEDEDIVVDTQALPDGGPYTVLERVGASGDWQVTRNSTLPFLRTGTNLQYNQYTGATWQRTNVPSSDYVNVWVFAATTLLGQDQILFVPGQAVLGSAALASAELVTSLQWGSMPFQEIAPLYKLTYQFNNGYGGTARCRLTEVVRIVGSFASVTQATQSDHGALTGLTDQDHPASAIIFTPVGTLIATDVQAALAELDTNIQAAGGSTVATVSATTQTAVANFHYVLTNVAATTVTLPASPTSGDSVAVTVANSLTTNVIARNAQTIMGVAEDMTIDNALATVTLRFLNNSWRLV